MKVENKRKFVSLMFDLKKTFFFYTAFGIQVVLIPWGKK